MAPNFVIPNPLNHSLDTFIFYQNVNDIKNVSFYKGLEIHEYTEIRLKMNDDIDKEKKFIIGCLKY